ncbi:MAG: bifunctional proline dehydrogenase/L-glutamate gamma-semialdehyde dehydrogenase, partial [Bacteriovoracales bacterium]|nr:bifunctional proline dehydrogenase/L-glutamate gamma-semialdehyde dehydrogenase [Bacteriovoracales bacterium]
MSCHLPKICSRSLPLGDGPWAVDYYKTDQKIFADESCLARFYPLLEAKNFHSFREQVHIKTVPFLMAVDYDLKRVSFLSPRGHRELFLLKEVIVSKLSHEEKVLYDQLRKRTERVLAMDENLFPSWVEKVSLLKGLPDLSQEKWSVLDLEMGDLKKRLTARMKSYRRNIFEFCSDYGLMLTARYDLIRIHLLKFVASLSSLDFDRGGQEVTRLFSESLRRFIRDAKKINHEKEVRDPFLLFLIGIFQLLRFLSSILPPLFLSRSIRYGVKKMAKRFIAGEDIEKARGELEKLMASGRDATLDQLGELVVSSDEADHYRDNILKLIEGYGQWIPKGEKNAAGIYRAHISIKISALCHDFNPHALDYTYRQIYPRLKKILTFAREREVFINIDAEHYRYRDAIFDIYRRTLLAGDDLGFGDYGQTGIVVQAYLRDAFEHLQEVIQLAKERQLTMPIRLVKGAYWDAETVEAKAHSYNPPEFINKEETDIHCRQLMIEILKNAPHVQLCVGGHNLDDHCYSEVLRAKYFPEAPPIEHQCLHMTYEGLSVGMAASGLTVRNYVPIGPLLVGMSYLVRRIMENSSQVGVLVQMRFQSQDKERPRPKPKEKTPWKLLQRKKSNGHYQNDIGAKEMEDRFFNTPPVRLYIREEGKTFEKTLNDFQKRLKGSPLHFGERTEKTEKMAKIFSPSDPQCEVGTIVMADAQEASRAVSRSGKAFAQSLWPKLPWGHRASYLLAVAHELLLDRLELAHLISFEAGKSAEEALGDVDEAVDFLNFYARAKPCPSWSPCGPIAVIGPWNFPLAIPCGMTAAPLAAGNTVLLKSAPQTPLIAQRLVDIFKRVDLPEDVLIHLPGDGETVGAFLVESPHIAGVAFTGSAAVGLDIAKKCAGRIYQNERTDRSYPVKTVTEMGGKNAIIVAADADLDEAVSDILYSAYAHAGQKCSACSRVLVDERVASTFLKRFSKATEDVVVGKAHHPETQINPLISSREKQRLLSMEEEILKEVQDFGGKVHANRLGEEFPGHSVGPLVVELPSSRAFIQDSFFQQELFAPVVHVVAYKGLDEAIRLFNATPYALTGGIYAGSQDDIDFLSQGMECGNLYV